MKLSSGLKDCMAWWLEDRPCALTQHYSSVYLSICKGDREMVIDPSKVTGTASTAPRYHNGRRIPPFWAIEYPQLAELKGAMERGEEFTARMFGILANGEISWQVLAYKGFETSEYGPLRASRQLEYGILGAPLDLLDTGTEAQQMAARRLLAISRQSF